MASRRIANELADVSRAPVPGVLVTPTDDVHAWDCVIAGPQGTPFEGGSFRVRIAFPSDFPFRPPKATFRTRIYHPNVDDDGAVCVAILKQDLWKPATRAREVLAALRGMIAAPDPDDPLQNAIADEFRRDPAGFGARAREWTKKYAE